MWYLIVSIPDLCNLITLVQMKRVKESKKDSKDQESIQLSTTPVPGRHSVFDGVSLLYYIIETMFVSSGHDKM